MLKEIVKNSLDMLETNNVNIFRRFLVLAGIWFVLRTFQNSVLIKSIGLFSFVRGDLFINIEGGLFIAMILLGLLATYQTYQNRWGKKSLKT